MQSIINLYWNAFSENFPGKNLCKVRLKINYLALEFTFSTK